MMRAVLRLLISLAFLVLGTASMAETLEECLQTRLDNVLAGEHVAKHANMTGVVRLALGRGNFDKIKEDPVALKRFESTATTVIARRISERAGEFVGATLELDDTGDKASVEGQIIAGGAAYNINITFAGRKTCKVNDVSIHGAFTLRDWVREQSEMQALMKEYKLAR